MSGLMSDPLMDRLDSQPWMKDDPLETICMAGNLSDGYKPYGPFEDYEAAFQFMEDHGIEGWVMQLFKPESKEIPFNG
jgi:hypothetical protein